MLKAWSYLCHMIGGQGVPPFPGLEGKGNVLGLRALSVSQAHTQNTWYIFFSKFEQPKRNSFPPLYSVGNQGEFGISLNFACTFAWVPILALRTLAV